jgi:hypothetical protein
MSRQKIPLAELRGCLIGQTTLRLQRDAQFLAPQIIFRERSGEPNWDANIVENLAVVTMAFRDAVNETKDAYDVDWPPSVIEAKRGRG